MGNRLKIASRLGAGAAALLAAIYILFFTPSHRPNILFISVDALRADHLGCYGSPRPTSPNLDRFAAGACLFLHAYAARGETAPSLASVLTGVYPSHHGVLENSHRLPEGKTTLPALLGRNGYDTAAFVSNLVIAVSGLTRDFARSRCTHRTGTPQWEWDAEATGAAIDFLGEDRSEPFFLWVHLMDPHNPYQAGPDDRGRFVKASEDLDGSRLELEMLMRRLGPYDLIAAEDKEDISRMYDEEVAGSDRRIGELLAALDRLALWKDTIVCVFADHGEELLDHNRYVFHTASVYRTVLHVPLIWRLPAERGGARGPTRVSDPVSLADIAPTVAALAGLRLPHAIDGFDLSPALAGGAVRREAVFAEYGNDMCSAIAGSHHFLWNPEEKDLVAVCSVPASSYAGNPDLARELAKPLRFRVGRCELYADPKDQVDLAPADPETSRRLQAAIEAYLARRQFVEPDVVTEEEYVTQLQELGYTVLGRR